MESVNSYAMDFPVKDDPSLTSGRGPVSLRLQMTPELPQFIAERFAAIFDVVRGSLEEIETLAPDVLIRSITGPRMGAAEIRALPPSVRAIGTYSVGLDHIDLPAARARGLAVFNTPGVLGDAVAEAAMLLLLGAARRATESIALVRSGEWQGWTPGQLIGLGLTGRTLGIVGMGDIGRRLAVRARAFGMRIAYHNRRPLSDAPDAEWMPLEQLVSASDCIVLVLPSTPETRGLVDARFLERAKPTAILVNIGRGDLVDDDALIDSLSNGRLFAAGLDVFAGEPHFDKRYLALPNAFLLPHIGSSTYEARLGMADALISAIADWSMGHNPPNRVA